MLTYALVLAVFAAGHPGPVEPINAAIGDASWIARKGDSPTAAAGEVERIRVHLEYVADRLAAVEPGHLNAAQHRRRAEALRALRIYAEAGIFPQRRADDGHGARRPRFIDDRGVHCAVGELIRTSGHAELARSIDQRWSHAYVPDIASPALLGWADEHGFTVSELAAIQPSYTWRPRIMKKIYFPTGASATVPPKGKAVLDEVVQVLHRNPDITQIRLEGHTDSVGTSAANQKLSVKRAETIMRYMVGQGIDAGRLSVLGHGETKPRGSNADRDGRAENRRVEFIVVDFKKRRGHTR